MTAVLKYRRINAAAIQQGNQLEQPIQPASAPAQGQQPQGPAVVFAPVRPVRQVADGPFFER